MHLKLYQIRQKQMLGFHPYTYKERYIHMLFDVHIRALLVLKF